ncbi:MAG: alpha/beta hydrolase, partial [Microbacterium sp.]|nr:alpha/beta hydrolase [Microbacterium sp.]
MKPSRHAAPTGATPMLLAGVRAALATLSVALVGVLGLMGLASLRMARRVVTPAVRTADTRILGLDVAAQT